MDKKRTIFIADPHGAIDELNELIDKVKYNPDQDRLILLGDLIDRGPDSCAVVRRVREINADCIVGNHDNRFLKWLNSWDHKQPPPPGKEHYTKLSEQDIQYIKRMPLYIELDDVIAIHAGLKPNIPLQNQSWNDLLYLRYTDKDRRFIGLKTINKIGKEAAGAIFWTAFGPFGDKSIVYGHHVSSYEDIRVDRYSNGTACYGIDTGCCFSGGRLTALIWETKEVVQVQAKQVYCESSFFVR